MEILFKGKIFITGINGFTGTALETYFTQMGYEVFGTTLTKTYRKNHFVCDVLDKKAIYEILELIKPDYIIHLAAVSFTADLDKEKIYRVNIFGTLNLLNAIDRLAYKPKKILIASSAAVYGNIEGELDEALCPKPVNHYGNSKLVMENMVKEYFTRQNIIITRPFNYTGIGQENKFLIPKIISHYKQKKEEIELGNINTLREFNDINFIIKCYLKLILSEVKSEITNVCSSKVYSISNIIDIMNKLAGYEINVKINPKFIRENEIWELKGSINKITSLIGSFTEDFKIENTLEKMYSYNLKG